MFKIVSTKSWKRIHQRFDKAAEYNYKISTENYNLKTRNANLEGEAEILRIGIDNHEEQVALYVINVNEAKEDSARYKERLAAEVKKNNDLSDQVRILKNEAYRREGVIKRLKTFMIERTYPKNKDTHRFTSWVKFFGSVDTTEASANDTWVGEVLRSGERPS